MAMSIASVTTDTTNYIRIHLILMKGGTLLTKTLFFKRVKDLSPAGHELTVEEFLGQHSVKILSTSTGKNNEDKLYPMTGTTNLDEWDLPLYCFILKTVCDLPMINKLDMGYLKKMRNELSHLHDPSLTDADFKNHLSTIEPIFTRSLQMINDPLFEKEMKTLLQQCETGALAVDEVVKVHHDSNRKHIELLSNQVKMMKNQVDMMKNQGVMLQNQTTQEGKIDSALSMLTEIKDRLPPNSDVDIPDVHVIIEVKNCTKEKEKELLDFLVKQFNETISQNKELNKDFPNLAMYTISEAICKTFKSFLEKGRHVIKVENGSISLTLKCNNISSFVGLIRDYIDGKLLNHLKDLKDAIQSWDGCTYIDFDLIVSPDEITEAILKLAKNLDEIVPKGIQVNLPPEELSSSTMFDISTSKEDASTSCSTSSIFRLAIKPETGDRRTEIEKCFSSGSISERFERCQRQLRKDPNFTNVEIEAKILAADSPRTGFLKNQESEASLVSEGGKESSNLQDTQDTLEQESKTKRLSQHVIDWIMSLPKTQTQYEVNDLVRTSSLYLTEESGINKLRRNIQYKESRKRGETEVPTTCQDLTFWLKLYDSAIVDGDNLAMENINQEVGDIECSLKPFSSSGIGTGGSSLSSNDASREHPDKLSELRSDEDIDIDIKIVDTDIFASSSVRQKLENTSVPEPRFELSSLLSDILDNLGINEETVLNRRRTWLLTESLMNIQEYIKKSNISSYIFGSQIEGTTTTGLRSEIDVIVCNNTCSVIRDLSESKAGVYNLLIVQAKTISPGYCLLEWINSDVPCPFTDRMEDFRGRIVLNNTDFVSSYICTTLPEEVENWLQKSTEQDILTTDMASYIRNNGFFLVPAGKEGSENKFVEWRMSFLHAERCLFFSLNVTQLQCYVLMKMIVRTHLFTRKRVNGISSYICKQIFLHNLQENKYIQWKREALAECLRECLVCLKECIFLNYCPHFIIKDWNLLDGRLHVNERRYLVDRLEGLLEGSDIGLLAVEIDQLGSRLCHRFNVIGRLYPRENDDKSQLKDTSELSLYINAYVVSSFHNSSLSSSVHCLDHALENLLSIFKQGNQIEQVACRLLVPLIAASVGCQKASLDMTPDCLKWCRLGSTSDVASGRLKQASVFYYGDAFERAENVLTQTENQFNENVVIDLCVCRPEAFLKLPSHFPDDAYFPIENAIQKKFAFCVKFLPQEYNCIPKELRYEMFRSTSYDLAQSDKLDFWMGWSVVDSLPYLYFLQYKTYGHLKRRNDQCQALENLKKTITNNRILGHTETAINLLGQCYRQEKRHIDAFRCFCASLKIQPRNNVANWHLCMLLASRFSTVSYTKNI